MEQMAPSCLALAAAASSGSASLARLGLTARTGLPDLLAVAIPVYRSFFRRRPEVSPPGLLEGTAPPLDPVVAGD